MVKTGIHSMLPAKARNKPLILFDGVCNLCTGFTYFVIKRDQAGKFLFVPAQTSLGQKILKFCNQPLDDFVTIILIEEGHAFFKSDAFLLACRHLRFPWPYAQVARIIPKPLRDWLYDRVAKNRYRLFGRKEKCMVPDAALAKRFLK